MSRHRRLHGPERTLHAFRSRWPELAIAILGLAVSGCGGGLPRPADPGAATPGIVELGAVLPSSGWAARGDIDWMVDGRRGHGRVRMLLADSERVRVDIQPRGAFGLGGGHAVLWVDREQVLWQEGSEPPRAVDADAIFAPILGGRATGADLQLLLLGVARLPARWPAPPWEVASGGDPGLMANLPDGASERATIAGPPLVLTRLERRDRDGEVQFRARFSDFAPVLQVEVARQLDLEAPGQGNKLQIQWQAIDQGAVSAAELGWPEAAAIE